MALPTASGDGLDGKLVYRLPAGYAAAIPLVPASPLLSGDGSTTCGRWSLLAQGLEGPTLRPDRPGIDRPDQVLAFLRPAPANGVPGRPSRATGSSRDANREGAREIWADLLRFDIVGIHDDYFELGGTSLKAVDLFTRTETRFGVKLPLTSLIEAPTVQLLAKALKTRFA